MEKFGRVPVCLIVLVTSTLGLSYLHCHCLWGGNMTSNPNYNTVIVKAGFGPFSRLIMMNRTVLCHKGYVEIFQVWCILMGLLMY